MYIRRKVFSVGIDEYGEERLFSVNEVISEEAYLDQREFNSKAAKALNEKYLRQVIAPKTGIKTFESAGYKTVSVDPKKWKRSARLRNKFNFTSDVLPAKVGEYENVKEVFNDNITNKVLPHSSADKTVIRAGKKKFPVSRSAYDHAGPDPNSILNNPSYRRDSVEELNYIRKRTK